MKATSITLLWILSQTIMAQAKFDTLGFVKDQAILDHFTEKATALFNDGEYEGSYDLSQSMRFYGAAKINYKNGTKRGAFNYEELKEGVLIVAKLYLCENCPHYHLNTASGFVINEQGYCVTNHHMLHRDKKSQSMILAYYAMDHEGNVFPIKKVVAASQENDLAIFKIESKKPLQALQLGTNNKVGDPVHLISHPDKMFYTYANGVITRSYYHSYFKAIRQSMSAEFAKGSSGAPVFNDKGHVVGIVSATRTITYTKDKGVQMVVRDIIPVNELVAMCSREMKSENAGKKFVPGMRF
ncbi:MAG: serine protease [Bacteroidales bacterium]|nr:serine protease [Bacteroidales bacterium]